MNIKANKKEMVMVTEHYTRNLKHVYCTNKQIIVVTELCMQFVFGNILYFSILRWYMKLQWSCVTVDSFISQFISSVFEFLGCCSVSCTVVSHQKWKLWFPFVQKSTNCAVSVQQKNADGSSEVSLATMSWLTWTRTREWLFIFPHSDTDLRYQQSVS